MFKLLFICFLFSINIFAQDSLEESSTFQIEKNLNYYQTEQYDSLNEKFESLFQKVNALELQFSTETFNKLREILNIQDSIPILLKKSEALKIIVLLQKIQLKKSNVV